ncbi:hypothetical protein ACRCPS_17385 [Pseudomonas aeruginosa]
MNQIEQTTASPKPSALMLAIQELLRVDAIGTRVSSKFNEAMGTLREAFAQLPDQSSSDGQDEMTFVFRNPKTGEDRTITLSRHEVSLGMSLELGDKLTASFCQCESVGETNVVDCCCGDLADEFELQEGAAPAPTPAKPARQWPAARDVGRYGDMSPTAHLRVGLDAENDVYVAVHDGKGGASVEFCTPFSGGGKSPRTREALINLMHAMEQDNAETPAFNWWERGAQAPAGTKP